MIKATLQDAQYLLGQGPSMVPQGTAQDLTNLEAAQQPNGSNDSARLNNIKK